MDSDPDLSLYAAEARVEHGGLNPWFLYRVKSWDIISLENPPWCCCKHSASNQEGWSLSCKEGFVDGHELPVRCNN